MMYLPRETSEHYQISDPVHTKQIDNNGPIAIIGQKRGFLEVD